MSEQVKNIPRLLPLTMINKQTVSRSTLNKLRKGNLSEKYLPIGALNIFSSMTSDQNTIPGSR
jgi:hypothetical protein